MLKDTLENLFSQMERLWPDVRRFLLPGMSEEEIARLEAENNLALSQSVKELLTITCGSVGTDEQGNDAPFLFPIFGMYRLMGLEEALEMRWDFLRGNCFNEYTSNWFPLFEIGYEDWLLVDVSSDEGAVLEYAAEDWEGYEQRIIFPSLKAMFDYIGELFRNGCYTLNADGELQENSELALETALARFDLPYWKERAEKTAANKQAREYEQTRQEVEDYRLWDLRRQSRKIMESKWQSEG